MIVSITFKHWFELFSGRWHSQDVESPRGCWAVCWKWICGMPDSSGQTWGMLLHCVFFLSFFLSGDMEANRIIYFFIYRLDFSTSSAPLTDVQIHAQCASSCWSAKGEQLHCLWCAAAGLGFKGSWDAAKKKKVFDRHLYHLSSLEVVFVSLKKLNPKSFTKKKHQKRAYWSFELQVLFFLH